MEKLVLSNWNDKHARKVLQIDGELRKSVNEANTAFNDAVKQAKSVREKTIPFDFKPNQYV